MRPIVDGLEEQRGDEAAFRYLNAEGDGQAAYDHYALRGHPVILIVEPDGEIIYQRSGTIPQAELEEALNR